MADGAILDQLSEVSTRLDAVNKRLENNTENIGELRRQIITKEHLRKRRNQAISWAVLVTLLGFFGEHAAITKCFLSPNQAGWSAQACADLFPGYDKVREQSQQNLASFQQLIAQVPEEQKEISDLQLQVQALNRAAR